MLPPGPWSPAIWQTYRYLTDPYGYSRRMRERHGKTIRVRSANGKGIATADPELIKAIFAADPDVFVTIGVIRELFGPAAVIVTAGPTHKRQRKLLNPRFHGAKMRALYAVMADVARASFERFDRAKGEGSVVVMTELTQDLTLDIIVEAVFGSGEHLDRAHVRAVLKELIDALVPWLFGLPALRADWNPTWRRFRAARATFDALVDGQVASRRAASDPGEDLLGTFTAATYTDGSPMEPGEIRDQLFTILMAGHETTAVSLAWAAHFVLRDPAVLTRLRGDLATVDASDVGATLALPYLQAVCSETLRIQPPVTDIARVCKRPLTLGTWTVPEGECVFVNTAALHRDESIYPQPERFRPERFLERTFAPWELTAFGGGQRRCLGAAFAEAELGVALAVFAREWNLTLASDEPEVAVRRGITMGPKRGVRVRVVGRR